MAKVCPLFSGSSGNSTYISCSEGGVLVDAGVSAKALSEALLWHEIDVGSIRGIFVTHEHGDHVDIGSIPMWFASADRTLYGPEPVMSMCEALVPARQRVLFERGEVRGMGPFTVEAVFCDHGKLSPQAIGVLIHAGGQRIYVTGDMTYRPDFAQITGVGQADVLIVPINGEFGNPDPAQAAEMAAMVSAKIVVPCHYWLFVEHGGDPAAFLQACAVRAPQTDCRIPAVGEWITVAT